MSDKQLNFNVPLRQLDGTEIKEGDKAITVGRIISSQLASANKGDALKLFNWAQKLYAGEPLSLDDSDRETLKEFIKNSEQLTVLSKAQALSLF